VAAARVYGQVRAQLESAGRPLADADLQIVATAILHDLELVTGNVKPFKRIPGLRISPVLADARTRS
jgi:predicted nucleic acid-binding protein